MCVLQASILGHLESLGLLCPGTCVAEFGAGRGMRACVCVSVCACACMCVCMCVRTCTYHGWQNRSGWSVQLSRSGYCRVSHAEMQRQCSLTTCPLTDLLITESVDSVCRDGTMLQYEQDVGIASFPGQFVLTPCIVSLTWE